MPPKRGRPAKSAVAAQPAAALPVVATETPKRRGRPSAAASLVAHTPVPAAQPKKRGRPSKALEEVTVPVEESKSRRGGRATKNAIEAAPSAPEPTEPKKRGGRPRKEPAAVSEPEPVAALPKRRGRAPKTVEQVPAVVPSPPKRKGRAPKAVTALAIASPKRKGRPAKAALDLNRVTGSPRITKRKSAPIKKAAAPVPAVPRVDPRIRSKLRTLVAPAPKAEAPQATKPSTKKRVGRPPKNAVASPAKKPAERKTKGGRVAKSTSTKSPAVKSKSAKASAVESAATQPKAAKPRKRRGYTTFEVPDKHARYLQDVLQGLLEQDRKEAQVAEEEAEMADDEEEVPQEQIAQEQAVPASPNNNIASKVAIAEQLIEDVAGGAERESYEEEPISTELSKNQSVEPESDDESEDEEPIITATDELIYVVERELDDVNGEQGIHGSENMDDLEERLFAEEIDPADDDHTPEQYNYIFGESPLATSTPAPPARAASAGPIQPFMVESALPSTFPSTMN